MVLPDGIFEVCLGAMLAMQGWQLREIMQLKIKFAVMAAKLNLDKK